jgi:integrase
MADSGFTFHSLRHATASLLHAQGLADAEVAKTLGHASPAVTKAIYQHVWSDEDSARDRVRDALTQGLGGEE